MSRKLEYSGSDIRFDYPKGERISLQDSRELICIDLDRMGSDFRLIINGCEVNMPAGNLSDEDARKVAVEIAIAEIAIAAKELIDENF